MTDPKLEMRLNEFLRTYQKDIIQDRVKQMRVRKTARSVGLPSLLDHLPGILRRLSESMEAAHRGEGPEEIGVLPELHAIERLGLGFEFDEVIAEYSLLRRCIIGLWE